MIVLFDVPQTAFDERHWEAVQRVARVNGGSVILVAGRASARRIFQVGSDGGAVAVSLDVQAGVELWPGEEPAFHFVPAPQAESVEMLKLPPDVAASGVGPTTAESEPIPRRWEQLPGCFRFLQLPEMHDENNWKPQARPLLIEEESHLPVLTEMRLAAGRKFFLGINETWRWRFKVGGRDEEHFWRQLIQYASEDPYFAYDGPLALDTDKVSAEPGESIHVRARITEELPDPPPAFSLDVVRNGEVVSEQALLPSGAPGGVRYGASLTLSAGDYDLRWTVQDKNKKSPRRENSDPCRRHERRRIGQPFRRPSHAAETGRGFRRRISDAGSGGPAAGAAFRRRRHSVAICELPLWDSPYLFVVVIGCFGVRMGFAANDWGLLK